MKKVAISIGDLNGIGIQLALENHYKISQNTEPIYCIDKKMLQDASKKLGINIPIGFTTQENIAPHFHINEGAIDKKSGLYSYKSFMKAVNLAKNKDVDAICTLPIHKKAWELAGVDYKGHTDGLRDIFKANAIMMLGCPKMYVALFTEHIPLKDVSSKIKEDLLIEFFMNLYKHLSLDENEQVAVLGLNPHAGDGGVLGDEEIVIQDAIQKTNHSIGLDIFTNPIVPDIAFTPNMRQRYRYFVAMYHDQGLAPLKALYFDEGINISLNLPITRVSVDHGTAFDIAYKSNKLNSLSYLNAINYIKESL